VAEADLLLVLALRDASLRTGLVARLSMAGAAVRTAQGFDERRPPSARKPAVLVTDAASVAQHPGGAPALAADSQWRCVVVLTAATPSESSDPRLLYLAAADATAALTRLLAGWQREA
jgi:hypothetical protein